MRVGVAANGFANTSLNSACENDSCLGELLPDYVGIDAQRNRRISVPEPRGHDVDRHPSPQQRRGVDVGWPPLSRQVKPSRSACTAIICKTVGSAYVGSNPTPATTCGNTR